MVINLQKQKTDWKTPFLSGVTSPRLTLQPLNSEDLPQVIAILSDQAMYRFIADLETADEGIFWINQVWDKRNYLFLAAWCLESREIIGVIVFNLCPDRTLLFGGFISSNHWGMGYAGEIIHGLKDHLAMTGSSCSIYADIDIHNKRARRAMEKSGSFPTGSLIDTQRMEYLLWPTDAVTENSVDPHD